LEAASLGEIAFSHTFDANVASTLGVVAPSITVFKHFDEKQVTFEGTDISPSSQCPRNEVPSPWFVILFLLT
jgi:hypothetical protein